MNEAKTRPQPKTDPLVRAIREAYRKTDVARLEKLLAEQSRWKRKATIANNKLAWVRQRIDDFADELAHRILKEATKASPDLTSDPTVKAIHLLANYVE